MKDNIELQHVNSFVGTDIINILTAICLIVNNANMFNFFFYLLY